MKVGECYVEGYWGAFQITKIDNEIIYIDYLSLSEGTLSSLNIYEMDIDYPNLKSVTIDEFTKMKRFRSELKLNELAPIILDYRCHCGGELYVNYVKQREDNKRCYHSYCKECKEFYDVQVHVYCEPESYKYKNIEIDNNDELIVEDDEY